jgi:hypothetical protein
MYQNHLTHHQTLKAYYPPVRKYYKHHQDTFQVNDHLLEWDVRNDPCGFMKFLLSLNRKRWCPISFVYVILAMSEIWSAVSSYLVQSRYWDCYFTRSRDIPSLWPSLVTCCSFGCNLTQWAQSIFPSCGKTNPALDAYATTYSNGIPEDTFSVT